MFNTVKIIFRAARFSLFSFYIRAVPQVWS